MFDLVCSISEMLGAVHHLARLFLDSSQFLAAFIQSLTGLLYGTAHTVCCIVKEAVTCADTCHKRYKYSKKNIAKALHNTVYESPDCPENMDLTNTKTVTDD